MRWEKSNLPETNWWETKQQKWTVIIHIIEKWLLHSSVAAKLNSLKWNVNYSERSILNTNIAKLATKNCQVSPYIDNEKESIGEIVKEWFQGSNPSEAWGYHTIFNDWLWWFLMHFIWWQSALFCAEIAASHFLSPCLSINSMRAIIFTASCAAGRQSV